MKKVKMISVCALLAVIGMTAGGLSLKTAKANGDLYDGFELVGASVRMVEPTGIRFHTNVPEEIKDVYTFGTLIIPVADLGDNELTVSTANVANVILGENGKWQPKESYEPWCYTSVLAGVSNGESILAFPKSQYNAQIAARSYALDENGNVVYYTTMQTRSVAYVASCALATTAGVGVITDTTNRMTLTGMVDYVLGDDGFEFKSENVELSGMSKIDLSTLFAETNGNEGMTAIWEVMGNCLSLEYDENGIATGAVVNGEGTATLSATIGSTTKELTVTVDLKEWYEEALKFDSQESLMLVENSYVKDSYEAASIVQDGDKSVLSASFGAKGAGGYSAVLAIDIGGGYKASEIDKILISFKVIDVGSASGRFYKAGVNVTAATSASVSEISIASATMSNGTAKPTLTTDYITMPIAGDLIVNALGSGDTVVNNFALWLSYGSTVAPITVYIDSVQVVEKKVAEDSSEWYKEALKFDSEDSLAVVDNSYSAGSYAAASIVKDGDRSVLSANFGIKDNGGYDAVLAINIGGFYKASEIKDIVLTFRVVNIGNASGRWYRAGVNVTSTSSSSVISVPSANMSNGTAKVSVTENYITMTLTSEKILTALGNNGDTIINNFAIWLDKSGTSVNPISVYVDSVVVNLN